ncbi:MAG: amidophosphoribosyltransferase [Deltaproteobacteria bacterium]|nr:amidophosphoribosyltransferase [Deltaproteobacteria bacterium]
MNGFHDECGVFGVFGHPDAAKITYLGLHGLQHRGQESAGIATSDGGRLHLHRQMGLVVDVFSEEVLAALPGDSAIGHVRYSTAGSSSLQNAQPIRCEFAGGALALAHNGNIINSDKLQDILKNRGHVFQSSSDSEVLLHLVADSYDDELIHGVTGMMNKALGAYSTVMLSPRELIIVRDPRGFRPLVIGQLDDALIVASETTSLDLIGASVEREVEPGEVITVDENGVRTFRPFGRTELSRCVFEHIYFARPDSIVFGQQAYTVRKELGRQLAREQPVEGADLVIPVPDSGVSAAIGFSEVQDAPFDMGLVRSHYVGRTFIEPEQRIRHFGVKLKLNPVPELVRDRVVVVVDDSIVRGTTSRKIVEMVRSCGPKSVHMRISSPPTTWPCYYGIDTPSRDELIAANMSIDQITESTTADSVGYLSVAGMHRAVSGSSSDGYCDACFTGNYPVKTKKDWPPRRHGRKDQC